MNQRWFQRLGTWRDPSEIIDTRAHEVAELLDDATPKAFVEELMYRVHNDQEHYYLCIGPKLAAQANNPGRTR